MKPIFFKLEKVKQGQETHVLVINPTSNTFYLHGAQHASAY